LQFGSILSNGNSAFVELTPKRLNMSVQNRYAMKSEEKGVLAYDTSASSWRLTAYLVPKTPRMSELIGSEGGETTINEQ
jgi:hypothetical protein